METHHEEHVDSDHVVVIDKHHPSKAFHRARFRKTMPRWHATWESHAFESIAKKKALILSPPELYAEITHLGVEKSKYPWYKVMLLSIVAGGYVGLGATTCYLIGGMMNQAPWYPDESQHNYGLFKLVFGAVGFPFAFMSIIVCGSELFTSQCAYTMSAWLENQINMLYVFKMLILTWIGNFIGCLIVVGLFYLSEAYHGKDQYIIMVTEEKLALSWGVVFVKGIFANWLVGIATWMANAALDLTGKAVAVWLPISSFAAIGFEHCIANMFVLMMGTAQGAEVTVKGILWDNLIPATLGNWVGGAIFVAALYSFVYGKPNFKMTKDRFY
jgi:formate/nitrite transporter